MSDPIQEAFKRFVKDVNAQWPTHRDNLRRYLPPGVQIPEQLIPDLNLPVAPPPALPRGEQFLAACVRNTRGLRYTWGGDTFKTFDCSALVVYGARDLGINMPRTTYQQINSGVQVSWEDKKIGDLIFSRFSAPRTPEHVSIYAGNGKVYEAGDPIDFYEWGDRGMTEVRRIV